jgi:hypothetical protein
MSGREGKISRVLIAQIYKKNAEQRVNNRSSFAFKRQNAVSIVTQIFK